MNDIDLSSFNYGGMNVTGFRIVDVTDNPTVRNFLTKWEKEDEMWVGAGSKRISVRTYQPHFYRAAWNADAV